MDPDRLLRQIQLPSPGDAEMAELAQALQIDLAHYKAPRGRAIRHAARREGLDETTPGPPALQQMFKRLRRAVADWIASLPTDPTHPFLAGKPAQFRLEGWSVVSGRDSHHAPHIHTESWANGVYYVEIPAAVEDETRRAGWLRVGPPGAYGVDEREGWPERWVKPRPGLAVMLPSHFHHETRKLAADARRICFAFQIYAAPTGVEAQ
jgi:hypothetical protein